MSIHSADMVDDVYKYLHDKEKEKEKRKVATKTDPKKTIANLRNKVSRLEGKLRVAEQDIKRLMLENHSMERQCREADELADTVWDMISTSENIRSRRREERGY